MKTIFFLFFVMLVLFNLVEAQNSSLFDGEFPELSGEYLGQGKPGMIPQLFAPFLVADRHHWHSSAVFSHNGNELFFSVYIDKKMPQKIFVTKNVNGQWTAPEIAPFSGVYQEGGPLFNNEGTKMFYSSCRPDQEGQEQKKVDKIWFVERQGTDWSRPKALRHFLGNDENEWFDFIGTSNSIYFKTVKNRELLMYRSLFAKGEYQDAELLQQINIGADDFDPVEVNEDYFIYSINKEYMPGWFNSYLYISYKNDDGTWTPIKNMGDMINHGQGRFPNLSPDGKYLFFTSYRTGTAKMYWVDSGIIDYLKENNLSLIEQLYKIVKNEEFDAVKREYERLKKKHSGYYRFDEVLFSEVAFSLLKDTLIDKCCKVVDFNKKLYPEKLMAVELVPAMYNNKEKKFKELKAGIIERVADGVPFERELYLLGGRLLRASFTDYALTTYKLNAELYPKSEGVYIDLAKAYVQKGDLAKAILNYQEALRINPENGRVKKKLEELSVK